PGGARVGTAMSDDDAVDDGKPQTRTLTLRLGGEKRLEGMLLDGLAHADAVVDAFNPEIPAGAHIEPLRRLAVDGVKPGRERDHALARADGIGGVGNEIQQDVLELRAIAQEGSIVALPHNQADIPGQ